MDPVVSFYATEEIIDEEELVTPFNFGDVLGVESLWFKQLFTELMVKQQSFHTEFTQH